MPAARFETAAICSPHVLATEAGRAVLAGGGNALDAAIATNLVLGVVAPYLCGFGGDLFALLWRDGLNAYNGSGRAPAGATIDEVLRRAGRMPLLGPLTITVPGAVEGWFALLERFGSRTFSELAEPALRYARDGFVPSERGARSLRAGLDRYDVAHRAAYAHARPGERFAQPELAATILRLANDGPDVYYRGEIGASIAGHVRAAGGVLDANDLAAHRGEWVEPLRARWRDLEVVELPPNTQGIAVLEALAILGDELPADPSEREHALIEATKFALSDLRAGRATLRPDHRIDPDRAAAPPQGPAPGGGTAFICSADSEGMCVGLIQSNFSGFGSGLTVPGWGINLHNRGTFFSLEPGDPHALAPGARPLHTLIPAMVLRAGRPHLVFGTMGGVGQAQTHVQLLARILADGEDPQDAVGAPRWFCDTRTWGVTVEDGFDPRTLEGLRRRGHYVEVTRRYDQLMGHAHAILRTGDVYAAASDPRAEGAALGC